MKWLFSVPGGSILFVDEIELARGDLNISEFVFEYCCRNYWDGINLPEGVFYGREKSYGFTGNEFYLLKDLLEPLKLVWVALYPVGP